MRVLIGILATLMLSEPPRKQDPSGTADRVQTPAAPEALPEWLPKKLAIPKQAQPTPVSANWPGAFVEGRNIRSLGALSDVAIELADARVTARYAGLSRPPPRVGLARAIEPAPISLPGPGTIVRTLDDGRRVWTLAIQSPGAHELRAHFSDVDLGRNTMLIYARQGERLSVRGPITGRGPERDGDFWSPSIPGDRMYIEVVGFDEPRLEIHEVIHVDRDVDNGGQVAAGDCPGVCPCHLDVMCQTDPVVNTAARQATGRMRYLEDGSFVVCTGTLIADLDPGTFIPYFLTAAHCIDSQAVANTLEVTWFYQSDNTPTACSSSPNVPNPANLPSSVGATLLHSTGPPALTNDSALLRLNGALPEGIAFAGWTTAQASGVVGIHHPNGSWKRAVYAHFQSLATDCGADCGCFDSAFYAFYDVDDGIIQGGSSGSGMFNAQGQLIGQLFGHCTLCPDAEDCSHAGDWCLMYGEWENTYPAIRHWMELGGSIHVDAANTSGPWVGTTGAPFRTVADGYNFAWNDPQLRLLIHAGNYPERFTLNKRIRLTAHGGVVRMGGP